MGPWGRGEGIGGIRNSYAPLSLPLPHFPNLLIPPIGLGMGGRVLGYLGSGKGPSPLSYPNTTQKSLGSWVDGYFMGSIWGVHKKISMPPYPFPPSLSPPSVRNLLVGREGV